MSVAAKSPAIAVHGGAGNLARYKGTGRLEEAHAFLGSLIDSLHADALQGETALNIVTKAVVAMENCGLFHAGKGSSPSTNGIVELDASIMDGGTLNAGGVIGVVTPKNPILLARHIMQQTKHVLMFGAEADAMCAPAGIETIGQDYFVPCDEIGAAFSANQQSSGTVGAVARDAFGNFASATSTGGVLRKTAGRVGDAPIIGAGTYAANGIGAVSCTGFGEYFIRTSAAFNVVSRMDLLGESPGTASGIVMEKITQLGGLGGMIVVGSRGEIAMPFTTTGMYRAAIDAFGQKA